MHDFVGFRRCNVLVRPIKWEVKSLNYNVNNKTNFLNKTFGKSNNLCPKLTKWVQMQIIMEHFSRRKY